MHKQVVKLEPKYSERIWGGQRIKQEFNGKTDIDPVGELWSVVAFENDDDNRILALDTTLGNLYKDYPDWFNCDTDTLPIRCSILDPLSDLSVQVHPTEEYAKRVENSFGKPEAWYVIDAKEDSKILFGHTAQSRDELVSMVNNGHWKQLLSYVDARAGDFLMVEAGDLHALGKDILCFEIARAADITYRVYDYDRIDQKTGEPRELHLEKSLDVINVPHHREGVSRGEVENQNGYTLTTYIDAPGKFTLLKIANNDVSKFNFDRFYFLTAIVGDGKVENQTILQGETYLVPDGYGPVTIEGDVELIVSSYRNL